MAKGKFVLIILAVVLMGCSTTSLLPVDDVYYWPDAHYTPATPSTTTTHSQPTTPTTPSVSTAPKQSEVEYINVQDTTVTIRIKK